MRMPKIPRIAGFVFYSFCASWIWACLGLGLFYSATGRASLDRWDLITVPLLALISVLMAGLAHREWTQFRAAPSSSPDAD